METSTCTTLDDLLTTLKPQPVSWNEEIKRSVLHHLLTQQEFFLRHRAHFTPECFPERCHEIMLRVAVEHYDTYGKLPSVHAMRERMRVLYERWPKDWFMTEAEIFAIYEHLEEFEPNTKYLDDLVVAYIRHQAAISALKQGLALCYARDEDRYERLAALVSDAVRVGAPATSGLLSLAALDAILDDLAPTKKHGIGFLGIDGALEGGLAPGEVGLFLGDSGMGKSQVLTHVAAHLLRSGVRVLFVSVENGRDVVLRRFRSALSNVPMREVADQRAAVTAAITASGGENVRILCHEMGSVSVADLAAEIAEHRQRSGWSPEVVVLDYIDELMRYSEVSTYESQGYVMSDFRALCQKIGVVGITATQANRQAATASFVSRNEIGDSYWKVRRTDALWTLNADAEERKRGVMRIYVDKHRNGRSNFHIYLKADLTRCRFVEISEVEYMNIMKSPPPP